MSPSLLVSLLLVLDPQGTTAPPPAEPAPIADNSFLVEEAYNQERGVVQHISTFTWSTQAREWGMTFTQEWPFNPAPRHQLSYTLTGVSAGAGAGFGDTWLNWRYQLPTREGLAIAPRMSVLVPTGSATRGRGVGGVGVEWNLPVSVEATSRIVLHSNLGGAVVPHAANGDRQPARALAIRGAQSLVWLAHPRFNALIEVAAAREQLAVDEKRSPWTNTIIVNPGVRWAHDFASGLQIVPGVAFPINLRDEGRTSWSVLGYLSLEHPFGKRR